MAKRILVTGAAGMVGEETVAELVRRGDRYEVVAFDLPLGHVKRRLRKFGDAVTVHLGDLRRPQDLDRALEGVDMVIHLAALIPPRADEETEAAESTNATGTQLLVDAMQRMPEPPGLLHMSSVSVYGDRLDSHWIKVGDPIAPSPHDHYAVTKIAGEESVQSSDLAWTIFRLTGVMSHRVKMSPLMFHMPLDTRMEIITARDAGYALAQALERDDLRGRIFNLGGGPRARCTYREPLDRHLTIMGLGEGFIPEEAFAAGNFHCGYYRDSEELNDLLGHHRDGLDEWFQQVQDHVNPLVAMLAAAFRPVARWYLMSRSEPLAARRSGKPEELERFCIR